MANPGPVHWAHLKHLLRYLAGTRSLSLNFNYTDHKLHTLVGLHGYTDSSYADCPDTSRSTLAYCFFLDSALLSWYSKLNTYVTTCTNHSEYVALALGAKEAEWLILLVSEVLPSLSTKPMPVYVDNSGIVSMVYNPVDHQSNKHVKIGCHYTEQKIIAPQRIPTSDNIADIFTKPLGGPLFKTLSAHFMAPSLASP